MTMKSTSATVALLIAIFLGSCTSFSKTSHLFEFYGATQESFGRDFFYVQYGVVGASTATYTSRGGGYVREGLIADAKKNLIKAHPLGPNQSYVNMSIDISRTESGPDSDTVTRIELTATISADVIQFGAPPMNYEIPVAGSNSSTDVKVLSQPIEKDGVEKPEPKTDVRPVIIAIGSEVLCQFKGDWFSGVVVEKNLTGTQFQVKFDRYGRTTTRWFGAPAVRLKD